VARDRRVSVVVVTFAAMILAACEVPLGPAEPSTEPLSGEWVACLNDGGADYARHMFFYPDSLTDTTRGYATMDGTCGGAETGASSEIWRYRLEQNVPAHLGPNGTEVLAREMNLQNSFETLYTLVYVDALSSPPVLYFGDLTLDPAQDGTAPEKRPDLLAPSSALVGQ
jgi:hypothetical protein